MNVNLLPERYRRQYSFWFGNLDWFQKAGSVLGWVPRPDRWIFIVGCYNSGTTLLREVLGSHPSISSLPREGVFLTNRLPYPEQFGWNRMWHKCEEDMKLSFHQEGKRKAEQIKRQWSLWFDSKPNLSEKSIANAPRLLFFQKYFQPAYFIYIIRNGFAVAEGIQRRGNFQKYPNPVFETEYPIELCARQWARSDEIVQAQKQKLEHFHTLKYEDFVENPSESLNNILDFLDLNDKPTGELEVGGDINEKTTEIRNMNPGSFARLTEQQIDIIREECGDRLRKYNYDVDV